MTLLQRSKVGATVLATFLALGCGGSDNGGNGGTTDPPTTGTIRATVTADGAARPGVTTRLFAGGGSTVTATQTTGTDGGTSFTNVPAGTHDVEIEVPDGHSLAEGEEARQSVDVTAGATADVDFELVDNNAGEVVEITLSGTSFSPADVTISPGTTVRWINGDGVDHTVTPDGHNEWSSASLGTQGAVFEHTFDNTGEFPYYCIPHQAQGMTGIIRVE
jgi:plastocyanin